MVTEKTNSNYQREFQQISMAVNDHLEAEEWIDLYKKLIYHELEIEKTEYKSMKEVLEMQKTEANTNFTRFVTDNYESWINNEDDDAPVLSHQLLENYMFPTLENGEKVFLLVIDNMRMDQWKLFEPIISEYFKVENEHTYFSILPTSTQYARNAIFSGLRPSEMEKRHSDLWVGEDQEENKNNYEKEFLERQLDRKNMDVKFNYYKVLNSDFGRGLVDKFNNMIQKDLNVIVYNFVDMLSHAKTDMRMIKELAADDAAYRSISLSWFQHSSLLEMIKKISEAGIKLMITTDHGTIRVKRPTKIIGDRNTNSNLRYKLGKNLSYDDKNVFKVSKPERFFLPKPNVSTSYAFATDDQFFVYPNNYNHYVNHYNDTFQHGGISMEEVIIPFVELHPK